MLKTDSAHKNPNASGFHFHALKNWPWKNAIADRVEPQVTHGRPVMA